MVVQQGQLYYYIFALCSEDLLEGYWITEMGGKQPSAERIKELENAAPLIMAQLDKQKSLDQVKSRFSGELLADLIMGQVQSVEIAKRRAELLGMRAYPFYTIVVVQQKDKEDEEEEHRNWLWPVYFNMPGEVLASIHLPVSYTHLDVYKRQR